MSRGTGQTHEFTQILLDAVLEPNARALCQSAAAIAAALRDASRIPHLR